MRFVLLLISSLPAMADGAHTITGCAVNQAGKPVAGVRIRIARQRGDDSAGGTYQVQTARNGCYRYGGLADGTYIVSAEPRGTLLSPAPQTVELHRDTRADFEIGPDISGKKTAQKNPGAPPVTEMAVSASCSDVWVAVLQAVQAPIQLRASDKDAGVLYFVDTSRLSDALSGDAVRYSTTARLGRIPGVWTDFGVDAMNFTLKPISADACSVRMDMAYSARNLMVEKLDKNTGRLPLYTNGAVEDKFLTELRDAANEHRQSAQTPPTIFRAGGDVSNPVPIYKPEPGYTEEARSAGVQGTVLLSLVVDDTGKTTDIKVIKSLVNGLDQKAVEAVSQWRFQPGEKDGKPVAIQAQIEVTFRLLDTPPESIKGDAGSVTAQSQYVRDGSIGKTNVEAPTNNWPQFRYIPSEEWVGKRVIFLPQPAQLRQYGYMSFRGGNGQFGQPTYAEAAGKIGRIVAIARGQLGLHLPEVSIQLEGSGVRYVGTMASDTLRDIAFLDEIDQAKKELTGKTLWSLTSGRDQIQTYDDLTGSYGSVKVKKFSSVKVTDVIVGWEDSSPIRLIVQTETGEEGFADVCISGTNISKTLAALTHIDRDFSLVDPKKAFPWPESIWNAIQDEKVSLGMTPEQVRMSWGEPKSIEQTVTAAGKSEQWVFGPATFVYFTGGLVSGVQAEK